MSEPSKSKREWVFYLDDMVAFGEKIVEYLQGLDQQDFVGNSLVYDATLRNLELIGEAATHIPDDVRSVNPQIPWRLIIATRNRGAWGLYLSLRLRDSLLRIQVNHNAFQ